MYITISSSESLSFNDSNDESEWTNDAVTFYLK